MHSQTLLAQSRQSCNLCGCTLCLCLNALCCVRSRSKALHKLTGSIQILPIISCGVRHSQGKNGITGVCSGQGADKTCRVGVQNIFDIDPVRINNKTVLHNRLYVFYARPQQPVLISLKRHQQIIKRRRKSFVCVVLALTVNDRNAVMRIR